LVYVRLVCKLYTRFLPAPHETEHAEHPYAEAKSEVEVVFRGSFRSFRIKTSENLWTPILKINYRHRLSQISYFDRKKRKNWWRRRRRRKKKQSLNGTRSNGFFDILVPEYDSRVCLTWAQKMNDMLIPGVVGPIHQSLPPSISKLYNGGWMDGVCTRHG